MHSKQQLWKARLAYFDTIPFVGKPIRSLTFLSNLWLSIGFVSKYRLLMDSGGQFSLCRDMQVTGMQLLMLLLDLAGHLP